MPAISALNLADVALDDIRPFKQFIEDATAKGFSNESQLRWWFRPDNRKENGLSEVLIDINGRMFVIVPMFMRWLMEHREKAA